MKTAPARWTTLLALLTFLASACGSGKQKDKKKKKQKKDLPPAKVDLPDPPPAEDLKIQEKNADGTYRVRGLMAHGHDQFGKEVEVKGVVVTIAGDCDPEEAKEKGEPCYEPHLQIKDDEDAEKNMLVVGLSREFLDEAELETGETYTIKGMYKRTAAGFSAPEDGVILANKIGDRDVVESEDE